MTNASLKEQLQAMAPHLAGLAPEKKAAEQKSKSKFKATDKAKKPKPQWLEYAQYGVELLRAYFPNCFYGMSQVKPLQKGIKQDLVKRLSTLPAIVIEDKACMVKSLAYYVNTASYHKSMIEGAIRVDLDGNEAGIVTAEEAKYAIDRHQARTLAKQAGAPKEATTVIEA